MPQHVVKRGLDIPIAGRATGAIVDLPVPDAVAYTPTEFAGVIPRIVAKPGTKVRAGDVLFHDKTHTEMVFLSPVCGTVREVRRGERRVITDYIVDVDGTETASFPTFTAAQIQGMSREEARSAILAGGLWAAIRTRPLSLIADPAVVPQSIVVSATETGPLQPGADVLLDATDKDALQAGLVALKALTDGTVFFTSPAGHSHPALQGLSGVEEHTFKGPHPAGDSVVQVNLVDPPRGAGQVWYVSAWDAARIGKLLLEGVFPAQRVYAAVGAGCKNPRFVRTVLGAPVAHVAGEVIPEDVRWIRGSVLTGDATSSDRWMSYYRNAIHVLPNEVKRELFGWTMPQLGRYSFHRAFLSGFFGGGKPRDLRPGIFGGHRGMVPIGVYRKVVATPDIDVPFLFKSISAGDIEESVELGMLDMSEEEAALCTFICPSKIEFDEMLRSGVRQYIKEA